MEKAKSICEDNFKIESIFSGLVNTGIQAWTFTNIINASG